MGVILKFLGWRGLVGITVALALSTALVVQGRKVSHWHHVADANYGLYQAEYQAHLKTQTNYWQAAEQARKADLANKQRAEAEQKATVERTKADYEERIARARADAKRLRDRAEASAHPGSTGTAGLPDHRGTGPGAVAAPEDRGLSLDERLVATEQAIQLDELIKYVNGLLKVDLSGRQ